MKPKPNARLDITKAKRRNIVGYFKDFALTGHSISSNDTMLGTFNLFINERSLVIIYEEPN